MPIPSRVVSLDLGSQTLGLAVFHGLPNGGLMLMDFCLREILADPAAESERPGQITDALHDMMRELRIKDAPVNYAVSSHSVFARFVKLPAVDQEKIGRIIAFEAQQNVPFPIDEVVWDYQLVSADAADKIEVVLVAIKADLLEEINAVVEAPGLQTTLVDVATMALYNAFRFNYAEQSGCSLLLDLGARTTNLLFIEPGKVFSRSIPIGGSSISAAIAKELHESFAAAERRKTQDAFVRLGEPSEEASRSDVARLAKLMRHSMTRLQAELTRSISFYRSQQQGSQPQRVFLCGGMASTPSMREFFHEQLHLPVEFFNPLRNVRLADSLPPEEVARTAHLLGELVGLALRGTMECPMELNLRPANVVRRQRLAERRPFLVVAAACFLLGLLGWGFYYLRAAQVDSRVADTLQVDLDRMRGVENRLDKLRKENARLDAMAAPLLSAINGRGAWLRILEDLNARLPAENIWITELAPISGDRIIGEDIEAATAAAVPSPTVTPRGLGAGAATAPAGPMIDGVFVRGLYLFNPKQQEIVVDYFRNLLDSPVFAIDPNDQSQVIKPSTPTNSEWAYPYELRLKLREPLPAP